MVLGVWVRAADTDVMGTGPGALLANDHVREARETGRSGRTAGPASECVWLGSDLLHSNLRLLKFPRCGGLVRCLHAGLDSGGVQEVDGGAPESDRAQIRVSFRAADGDLSKTLISEIELTLIRMPCTWQM